ncbi:hypothetical protein ES705_19277 [subsurface metagenome]
MAKKSEPQNTSAPNPKPPRKPKPPEPHYVTEGQDPNSEKRTKK